MKKIIISFFLVVSLTYASSINLAIAANVSYVMPEIIKQYNKENPNVNIKVIIGGSGKLRTQINRGAPFDIFMSANTNYPQAIYENLKNLKKPIIYAEGTLSVFTTKELKLDNLKELLLSKKIRKIAIANPKTAPYGKASVEVLKSMGIYQEVKSKLVYSESISQTVSYTKVATDIGFVASSSLKSSKMTEYKKNINFIEIDKNLYKPIKQAMILINTKNTEVKKFYLFLNSKISKKIFQNYGYIINE